MNRRLVPAILIGLVVAIGVDLAWSSAPFPGYAATIGLVGTIVLTILAKGVLSPLVERPPSFEGDDATPDVQMDVWGVRAEVGRDPGREVTSETVDDGDGERRDG